MFPAYAVIKFRNYVASSMDHHIRDLKSYYPTIISEVRVSYDYPFHIKLLLPKGQNANITSNWILSILIMR